MRPKPLLNLLESVNAQTRYPDAIIIVDGSTNNATCKALELADFKGLVYYQVEDEDRGLTKQRNFGISKVGTDIDVVCFLDDDIVLTPTYFSTLLETYDQYPDALGVGGYIINDVNWQQLKNSQTIATDQFAYDGWVRKDGYRFVLRKKLGLDADRPPGFMPTFAHGRSVSFLPPSGKIYKVEQFMGGVSSYKRTVLEAQKFSEYFEGYGLYEDADYTLRLSKKGELYVHTGAQLYHYHEASGRPNRYAYGKMVVRNGWYVWRVRFPKPSLKARFKWNAVSFLLTLIRLSNGLTSSKKKEAFTEAAGRFVGWLSVLVNPPKRK
jgi:GT2 family glycosyltransferase